MLNSTVLEVAIGMTFCFAAISLITSSLKEALSSMLSWRSKTLLNGVKNLLNDKSFTGLALDIYNHALVNPLSNGAATDHKTLDSMPSYIEPDQFAHALLDSVQSTRGDFVQLKADIEQLPDPQIKDMLLNLYAKSDNKLENFHKQIADWFDASMERVTGAYKRKTQWVCFAIAFSIAVAFNIDGLNLFKALWLHPDLVSQLNLEGHTTSEQVLTELKKLPIGWNSWEFNLTMLAGWLITASSSLFGAPFWFDTLQKLTNLRGAGAKPQSDGK